MATTLVYGHILPATDHTTATYWRQVTLDPEAAIALSRFYCGDDRAAGLRKVFVRRRRDADELEKIAIAVTGRWCAVRI